MKVKSTFMAPILFIVVFVLLALSRYIDIDALGYKENICLAIIVLQLAILIVPGAFYAKIKGEGYVKRLRIAPFGIEKLLVTFLATVTLILGDTVIKLFLYKVGAIDGAYSVYHYYLDGYTPGVLYSLVALALVPAVCEEFLFRSVLCAEYEENGALVAVIASSLFYAMFGMNFGYFPIYFFAGLIFALVMYLTRSVFASMLCHLIYNIFELAAGETVRTIITKPQSLNFLIFALVGLFLLCLIALFSECERLYHNYSISGVSADYHEAGAKGGIKKYTDVFLAPPLLAAVLIFIVAAFTFS